jgi:tRNA(adenine34) deaminase
MTPAMSSLARPFTSDESAMREALRLAARAATQGEVPVGAVVALDGVIIGRGANRPIAAHDPTAHAEIVALREAAAYLRNYRLTGADLYVTVEPCTMCAGALVHARIRHLVFGTREPRAGAIVSTAQVLAAPGLNHRVEVEEGVLADEAQRLMQDFFRRRRSAGQDG